MPALRLPKTKSGQLVHNPFEERDCLVRFAVHQMSEAQEGRSVVPVHRIRGVFHPVSAGFDRGGSVAGRRVSPARAERGVAPKSRVPNLITRYSCPNKGRKS